MERIPGSPPSFMLSFAVCMVIAVAVPFVLTVIIGKRKLASGEQSEVSEELVEIAAVAGKSMAAGVMAEAMKGRADKELKAFLTGKVIALKDVNDGVFSEGIMGDGMAIIPENDTLYAPADGTVSVLMQDSRHACGLTLNNGMEILLHIGIDTVDMKGDGFKYMVSEGQHVSAGTPLIQFDRDKIKAAGHPDTTVCIITEPVNAKNLQFLTGVRAEARETIVATFE